MKTADTINPAALYWASFNRFEFRLPGQAVIDCAHSGACDDDVAHWAPKVNRYEAGERHAWAPTPDKLRAELAEYGAWDDAELADDDANWRRIVWLAAGNIKEDDAPDCSEPVKKATA